MSVIPSVQREQAAIRAALAHAEFDNVVREVAGQVLPDDGTLSSRPSIKLTLLIDSKSAETFSPVVVQTEEVGDDDDEYRRSEGAVHSGKAKGDKYMKFWDVSW